MKFILIGNTLVNLEYVMAFQKQESMIDIFMDDRETVFSEEFEDVDEKWIDIIDAIVALRWVEGDEEVRQMTDREIDELLAEYRQKIEVMKK